MPFSIKSRDEGTIQRLTINDGQQIYTIPIEWERFDREQFLTRAQLFQESITKDQKPTEFSRLMVTKSSGFPLCIFELLEYPSLRRQIRIYQELKGDDLIDNDGYCYASYSLNHLSNDEWRMFVSMLIETIKTA